MHLPARKKSQRGQVRFVGVDVIKCAQICASACARAAHVHKLASGFSKSNGCKYSGSGVSSRSRRDAHIALKRVRQCLKELRWGKSRRYEGRGGVREEIGGDKGKEAGLEGVKDMKRGELESRKAEGRGGAGGGVSML